MRRVILMATVVAGCATDAPAPLAECKYRAGTLARDTLTDVPAQLPIHHVIVVTNENRSFDHLLGSLSRERGTGIDGLPAYFTNPDLAGKQIPFWHRSDTCFPHDLPHDEDHVSDTVDGGKMDGFVKTTALEAGDDGHEAIGYLTRAEVPFYYWLADQFAISDSYFSGTLGPTDANRDFLYAATDNGTDTTHTEAVMAHVRTIFDELDDAGVSWGVYTKGRPRQETSLGWTCQHENFYAETPLYDALAHPETLPAVAFVDPGVDEDEHPPHDVNLGEAFSRRLYEAVRTSPAANDIVLIFTYDEGGGIADHVDPPYACPPTGDGPAPDQLGIRVPVFVISPYARSGYVSHVVHSHTSILRLIELVWDLPSLTARDANSDALLDMFDFAGAPHALPAAIASGSGNCVHDPTTWLQREVWVAGEQACHM